MIDEVSWRMNTQACVNVYKHIKVKRVLTSCSDGGIDEMSWRTNTQACVNVHTHKSKESTYQL